MVVVMGKMTCELLGDFPTYLRNTVETRTPYNQVGIKYRKHVHHCITIIASKTSGQLCCM
jgi:hypothetical protein